VFSNKPVHLQLVAGFIGTAIDERNATPAVRPSIGWMLFQDPS
jgi:hypothetical protein